MLGLLRLAPEQKSGPRWRRRAVEVLRFRRQRGEVAFGSLNLGGVFPVQGDGDAVVGDETLGAVVEKSAAIEAFEVRTFG